MSAFYPYLSPPSVKEQATADIANRESIHMCEGQLSSLIPIAWQVHVCTPNKLHLFTSNIQTSQCSTTSLSPHLLVCLVQDLSYGPWPLTRDTMLVEASSPIQTRGCLEVEYTLAIKQMHSYFHHSTLTKMMLHSLCVYLLQNSACLSVIFCKFLVGEVHALAPPSYGSVADTQSQEQ